MFSKGTEKNKEPLFQAKKNVFLAIWLTFG
jgi:hypothetical protein